MTQDSMAAGQGFSIGGVLSDSIAVFLRNLGPFATITFLIGIPYILVSFWSLSSADTTRAAIESGNLPPGFFGMVGVFIIIFILTNTLTQSAIIYGTFQDLRGRRASFGDCLSRGLSALPRVAVAAILASIGMLIGFMLLFVPGIILILMWWVFVPAIVVEGAGITEAFGRSRALTRGHRWGILGLLVIIAVAQWVAGMILGIIAAVLGQTIGELVNLVVTLGFAAFASVVTAVGYSALRVEKEGIVVDDIARVFD